MPSINGTFVWYKSFLGWQCVIGICKRLECLFTVELLNSGSCYRVTCQVSTTRVLERKKVSTFVITSETDLIKQPLMTKSPSDCLYKVSDINHVQCYFKILWIMIFHQSDFRYSEFIMDLSKLMVLLIPDFKESYCRCI